MTLKKGDRIKTSYNGKIYELAGYWRSDYVFAPLGSENDQCLIYSQAEVEELLGSGEFKAVK